MAAPALLSRARGTVLVRSDEALSIPSRQHNAQLELNAAARLVVLLCDGRRSAADIEQLLVEAYPDQAEEIANDVAAALAELRGWGVIEEGDSARGLLKVAFANFWPGFDCAANYFVATLADHFDVVIVSDDSADVDVLFYANHTPSWRLPALPRRIKRVFVALDDAEPDFAECDYAFSSRQLRSHRHYRLPPAMMLTDWNAHAQVAPRLGRNRLPEEHDPRRAGLHLRKVLFGGALPAANSAAAAALDAQIAPQRYALALRAGRQRRAAGAAAAPKLTIGMATHDDFDGVYFTVQAIRLYHPEVADEIEIVIVDNDPEGPASAALRTLQYEETCRYVAYDEVQSTAVKDLVFREACGAAVLCVDGHVLIVPGALRRLIDFLDADPHCRDLLQGPMVHNNLQGLSSHFDPVWSRGMFGIWAHDPRADDPDGAPFEIGMQGTGLFACRRDAWLGFSRRFVGFGGEEGYIHEKYRRAGRRTLCLPFLRWLHRFQRPQGISYANRWSDRVRNYLIGHHELDLDPGEVERHFTGFIGSATYDRIAAEVREEIASPLFQFEAVYGVDTEGDPARWQELDDRLKGFGVHLRRIKAIDPTTPTQLNRIEAYYQILEFARYAELASVIVFEADDAPSTAAWPGIAQGLRLLPSRPWQAVAIGIAGRRAAVDGTDGLLAGRDVGLARASAFACQSQAYEPILEALAAARRGRQRFESGRPLLESCLLAAVPDLLVLAPAAAAS